MTHRDWEANQSLIHRHSNRKFMRLTPRTTRESPVIEVFAKKDRPVDVLLIIAVVCILVVVFNL